MTCTINKISTISILLLASALYLTACQDSVNPSLEESVAPYLELEAIEGASNTNVAVNRGSVHGLDSYFAFDLSNIKTNGLINEGVIEGWCLEWNKPIGQNNDVYQGVELYNTFGSDTWKAPNYLMNIKNELQVNDPELTYKEIQVALWALIDEPAFNIDKILQDGRMPSRMMTNGKPNFDVDKTKQIVSYVRSKVKGFEYKPGSPVIVFARTGESDQNIGGVTEQTVVVTIAQPNEWYFQEEETVGSGAYIPGPSPTLLGDGSAELNVDDNGRMILGRNEWRGVRLESINTLSYSTYRSSGSAALAIAMAIHIDYDDTDATAGWQGRLTYEPYFTQSVNTGEWQTWDTQSESGSGNWWASGAPGNSVCPQSDPCTWVEVLTNFPDAAIRDANYTGIILKAGGPWTGGFEGNVDNFKIGVGSSITTYDFQPLIFDL